MFSRGFACYPTLLEADMAFKAPTLINKGAEQFMEGISDINLTDSNGHVEE